MPPVSRLVEDLLVFEVEDYPTTLGGQADWHVHHFWQMDLCLTGCTVALLEQGRLPCDTPGMLLLIPPLKWHDYEVEAGHRRVTFKFVPASQPVLAVGGPLRLVRLPDALTELAASLAQRPPGDDPLAGAEALALTELCLAQALRAQGDAPGPAATEPLFLRQVAEILEEIAAQPFGPWTVAGLARRCRLSAGHFTCRFVSLFGQTPQRFLLDARMKAAAAALMADETLPIKQVADWAGYASVHAFTHAFTRVFRVPPAAFRRLQGRR